MLRAGAQLFCPWVPVPVGSGQNGSLCSTPGSLKVQFQDHLQEGPLGYLLKCRFLSPGPDLANRISRGQGLPFNTFSKLFYCKIIENRRSRPQPTHGPESSDTCQPVRALKTHTPKKLPEGTIPVSVIWIQNTAASWCFGVCFGPVTESRTMEKNYIIPFHRRGRGVQLHSTLWVENHWKGPEKPAMRVKGTCLRPPNFSLRHPEASRGC